MKEHYVYEPQRHAEKSLREPPRYGQGTLSYSCKKGSHCTCTKLTCPCDCHKREEDQWQKP